MADKQLKFAGMQLMLLYAALAAYVLGIATAAQAAGSANPPELFEVSGRLTIVVQPEVLHRIDPRVFGQFMERPGFGGEIGPEAAIIPGTRRLQPEAEQLIRDMNIPVLRFPGGTDVDYMDWTDMVDNLPGRGAERPVSIGYKGDEVTNAFGYDEFLQLCERNGSDAILVVNLRDALLEKEPIEEAAAHAAGLIAYCTATIDQELPGKLEKWPKLRAKNGRVKPYTVKYVQLGNETWMFNPDVQKKYANDSMRHWHNCMKVYIKAVREAHPAARIIVDAFPEPVSAKLFKEYGDIIEGFGVHCYYPWGIGKVLCDGKEIDVALLSQEDIWNTWVSAPHVDANGQAMLVDHHFKQARELGYKVAMTEWNWNGFWGKNRKKAALDSQYARGIGAASFLHSILRQGDLIKLATQSMLVGKKWQITAIRVDPENQKPAYIMPSGLSTKLYSQYCGDRMYAVELSNIEFYAQPYKMSGLGPNRQVAYVDVIATGSEDAVTVHMINRRFDKPQPVTIDCSAFNGKPRQAELVVMEGRLQNEPGEGESLSPAALQHRQIEMTEKQLTIDLPPRSIVFARIRI